jgi:hypothetical protein
MTWPNLDDIRERCRASVLPQTIGQVVREAYLESPGVVLRFELENVKDAYVLIEWHARLRQVVCPREFGANLSRKRRGQNGGELISARGISTFRWLNAEPLRDFEDGLLPNVKFVREFGNRDFLFQIHFDGASKGG